jgi:hypothetical protein
MASSLERQPHHRAGRSDSEKLRGPKAHSHCARSARRRTASAATQGRSTINLASNSSSAQQLASGYVVAPTPTTYISVWWVGRQSPIVVRRLSDMVPVLEDVGLPPAPAPAPSSLTPRRSSARLVQRQTRVECRKSSPTEKTMPTTERQSDSASMTTMAATSLTLAPSTSHTDQRCLDHITST